MGRWKKTKCCVLSLSLHKSNKKLIGVWLKKKMSSTTQGKIMPVQWILLEHQLKLSNVPREKLLELRNNLREKSMSWKLDLTTLTGLTLRDRSPLSVIKDNSEKLFNFLRMRPVQRPRLLSKLEYLSAKPHLSLEKLRRARHSYMALSVLNANSKETLLMHALQ